MTTWEEPHWFLQREEVQKVRKSILVERSGPRRGKASPEDQASEKRPRGEPEGKSCDGRTAWSRQRPTALPGTFLKTRDTDEKWSVFCH